ncbi:MAG: histone, partial [Burkholderiales bacterium]|nr:histone [Burkholderiales bacterium]
AAKKPAAKKAAKKPAAKKAAKKPAAPKAAAPAAPAAQTTLNPQAAWPFPTASKP